MDEPGTLYALCPFFRNARMVSRLTLKARAMPRCEMRSAKAPSMAAAVSGESARLFASGVQVFARVLQRSRAVPHGFVP